MYRIVTLLFFSHVAAWSQTISNFTLTDIRADKQVSLRDYARYPAVVLIFTSNNCAFDGHYRERILRMAGSYEQQVPFLMINSFTEPDESVENMKALNAELGFNVPYLADKNQVVMKMLNARKSPECVVLKPSADQFTVMYRGAIDDSPQLEEAVRNHWLRDAIEAVLAGKPIPVKEQRPIGCAID